MNGCTARSNNGTGISGETVNHCYASNNGSDGISVPNGVVAFCRAENNNQNNDGSVDIDATGSTRTGNKPAP